MNHRLTERDVVAAFLDALNIPSEDFRLDKTEHVITLCLSNDEWDEVRTLVDDYRLEEMTEAWRELPFAVWTDESWIRRVAQRVMVWAPDYQKLCCASGSF